jgi:Ca-activated chloride channel family protein
MPVGGTATARALERARELFSRDARSHSHVKVILLVTDGEDLEGDPVRVAEACAQEGTHIHVVQVGGHAPEMIPDVDPNGKVIGFRKDDDGKPLLTELSKEGEAQLASVAEKSGGKLVVAEKGQTGIDVIAKDLQKQMKEELSERVETVFDEFFRVPLGVAILLLALDLLVVEAPRNRRKDWRALRGAS